VSRLRVAAAKNWALYYGAMRPEGLQECDLVVLAPEGWDPASIQRLKAGGASALAYLSVLEVPRQQGSPPPPHVLRVNGLPMAQEAWNTWILDPRREETRSRLLQIADTLVRQGYDGFFLDTAGDVEDGRIPLRIRTLLLPATAVLVAALRERYPTLALVQNWGLGALLDLTRPHIDAVCWENFPVDDPDPWQEELALRLRRMAGTGLKVLALSAERPEKPPELAAQLGFPWYGAPGSYVEWAGGCRA